MFCPKCATQNLDGASYCRSCGANIKLVPSALSGKLPQPEQQSDAHLTRREKRRRRQEASLENAFRNVFMGIGFLLVAIALSFSRIGFGWWFWMLIPAFMMIGTGIAQCIRVKEREKQALSQISPDQAPLQPPSRADAFPARNTGELFPAPPSVTEGTTRHLGAEAPTRHLDPSGEPRK